MNPVEIKIAYIGGGSRNWARDLMTDLALAPRLRGRLALYDIDHASAVKNAGIARSVFARPEAVGNFRVSAERRLTAALKGADFVVISTEPGPMTMRYADLEIPARHGVVQPVGDTTGPGGFMRALRAIPQYLGLAQAIGEHCPGAWVINYTNPMTLCTAALHVGFPGIKAFGCCHEVFHVQERLAGLVTGWFGVERPARQEIILDITGINHFTWATAASWQGRDLFPGLAKHAAAPARFRDATAIALGHKRREEWFTSPGLIGLDLFRRYGALGAAGDRHLAEFVPWYATSESHLHRWGVVLTPYAWRLRRARMRDHSLAYYARRGLQRSNEEGVRLIEALLGLGDLDTNVNFPNRGQVESLPLGHVVETHAQFRRGSLTPVVARPLPAAAAALVRRVAEVQALVLEAARTRDTDRAFAALLADPLMHLPVDDAWKMFAAMLRHCRRQLPGWRCP